jgi:hypothetical protein
MIANLSPDEQAADRAAAERLNGLLDDARRSAGLLARLAPWAVSDHFSKIDPDKVIEFIAHSGAFGVRFGPDSEGPGLPRADVRWSVATAVLYLKVVESMRMEEVDELTRELKSLTDSLDGVRSLRRSSLAKINAALGRQEQRIKSLESGPKDKSADEKAQEHKSANEERTSTEHEQSDKEVDDDDTQHSKDKTFLRDTLNKFDVLRSRVMDSVKVVQDRSARLETYWRIAEVERAAEFVTRSASQ